ncbi:phospholipase C, phosphocholine-specific [Kribbella sandramycini]|uniref:phospholipase C n=1 Tax=Kribbella sandramycini TaxID=60450 RepID=A0A7Y4KYH4_9ACTN|nr:phospholipase C, phosphocholine-specific [Kribbella sandramycini]MBB6570010.1 phospholipase C [Kribbella sandramycini]NOL40166.1 phospholipase C, phosphocholine-specific [Kribbella sandramycini]
MPDINRRRFLQLAGASAGFAAMANSIEQAAAIPAHRECGDINDVEHIVVLMQENRSFDHYFGTLKGVRGFGDPRPVTLPSGKPVYFQRDKNGKEIPPFHPDADDLGLQFLTGLPHSWPDGHHGINRGNYDQWIPAKGVATMAYLTREDIPFHYALADKFTLCDAYHCSFIGATDPNRYYMWTGYTGNDGTGGGPVLGNDELGYGWTTYPERLEQAGVSWKIYQDIGDGLDGPGHWGWIDDAYRGNYGDNSLLYFNTYRNAKPGDPLFEKARTGTNAKAGESYFAQLRADVQANKLPKISWIAAPEAFTEHSNWPTNYGAWYISRVLDALTSNPKVWSKTALFVTYDENDGFFDHVVPPFPPADANQGLSTVDTKPDYYPGGTRYTAGSYGLGPRVPMFVVSPWSTGGYSCSEVFDHTSIIRFMEKRFGVHEPNISPWRRAICGDLTSAFDFDVANNRPIPMPDTTDYEPPDRDRHPTYVPAPPAVGAVPAQERGSRRTRPLPYASIVDGAAANGRFTLTFGAGPRAGAQFLVTAQNRTDGPWTYTTEAGKSLADSWNATAFGGVYDLTVHGPNGFLRTFKGKPTTALEITARDHRGDVQLTLTTDVARTVTLSSAYGGAPKTLHLKPGKTTHTITTTRRWYDVTVTTPTDPAYLRRYAGHVETGQPGLSDPAIRTT